MILSSIPPSISAVTAEPPHLLLSSSPFLSKQEVFHMHKERLCSRCLDACWRVQSADLAGRL